MKKFATLLIALLMTAACAAAASAVEGNDVSQYGTPIAETTAPQGGGNHDISIIIDGYIPVQGDGSDKQYDTFHGEVPAYEEYFGVEFAKEMTFTGINFVEGGNFGDGGFFADGSIKVQVNVNGTWTDVDTKCEPAYPLSSNPGDFGDWFEPYMFELTTPTAGTAIRVIGTAGGSDTVHFASCAELVVYSTTDTDGLTTYAQRLEEAAALAADEAHQRALARAAEGFIEGISTPITTYSIDEIKQVSGGSKNLGSINDGVIPENGMDSSYQLDTVNNIGKWEPDHEEYIGYTFDKTYTVEYVDFYEGGNFFDGGFYGDGQIWLEALVNGEWAEVATTISPDYPVGYEQEDFGDWFELYTFTLKTPVACDGIRVNGIAGGSAYFVSCSEMIVKVTVDAVAEEAPVVEEAAPVEEVVEETPVVEEAPVVEEVVDIAPAVVEEVVETPVVTAPVVTTAPQTFDVAVIAAVAAVISGAGYTVSRRKH